MIRHMADAWTQPKKRDVIIEHPNRGKASVRTTKWVFILLLLVSVALMVIVAVGGWNTLVGAKPLLIGYILVYLIMAFFAARWNRGVLPLAAALGIVLLIFAAISGPEWFTRDKAGFTNPPLDESIIGLITLLLVPVQVLLIAFAMRGFQQDWHVELERPADGSAPREAELPRGAEPGGAPA